MLGPLDVLLHKLHRLLELFIFLGEGLHPLDQLSSLFGGLSSTLQKHQDYEEEQSPTTKMNIANAVLSLICFITMDREDSSLLSSMVVSSSSTTTTLSPHLRRIQIA